MFFFLFNITTCNLVVTLRYTPRAYYNIMYIKEQFFFFFLLSISFIGIQICLSIFIIIIIYIENNVILLFMKIKT